MLSKMVAFKMLSLGMTIFLNKGKGIVFGSNINYRRDGVEVTGVTCGIDSLSQCIVQ